MSATPRGHKSPKQHITSIPTLTCVLGMALEPRLDWLKPKSGTKCDAERPSIVWRKGVNVLAKPYFATHVSLSASLSPSTVTATEDAADCCWQSRCYRPWVPGQRWRERGRWPRVASRRRQQAAPSLQSPVLTGPSPVPRDPEILLRRVDAAQQRLPQPAQVRVLPRSALPRPEWSARRQPARDRRLPQMSPAPWREQQPQS